MSIAIFRLSQGPSIKEMAKKVCPRLREIAPTDRGGITQHTFLAISVHELNATTTSDALPPYKYAPLPML